MALGVETAVARVAVKVAATVEVESEVATVAAARVEVESEVAAMVAVAREGAETVVEREGAMVAAMLVVHWAEASLVVDALGEGVVATAQVAVVSSEGEPVLGQQVVVTPKSMFPHIVPGRRATQDPYIRDGHICKCHR